MTRRPADMAKAAGRDLLVPVGDTDRRVAVLLITLTVLALLVSLAVIAVLAAQLSELWAQVDTACHGVIARLDLSEWVPLCKAAATK